MSDGHLKIVYKDRTVREVTLNGNDIIQDAFYAKLEFNVDALPVLTMQYTPKSVEIKTDEVVIEHV